MNESINGAHEDEGHSLLSTTTCGTPAPTHTRPNAILYPHSSIADPHQPVVAVIVVIVVVDRHDEPGGSEGGGGSCNDDDDDALQCTASPAIVVSTLP